MNVNLLAMVKANARRYGILLCLLILGTVGAFALGDAYVDAGLPAPTVTSDKLDYAPGEIAHITGSGWTLDQQVHVEFKEEPDFPDYHVYDVVVDANGNWKIDYQVEERHLGVKFTVTAKGSQSGTSATTVFTDGRVDFSVTGLPNNTDVSGITITYTGPGSQAKTESVPTFKSQTSSSSFGAVDNSDVNFTYPEIINGSDNKNYIYISSNPSTGFRSGKDKTTVVATYKKLPTLTWTNPSNIVYGTLLSATQLNATADVIGTFTYTPATGTKLNAGDGQKLSVTFIPNDNTYATITKTVNINVAKAEQAITWTTPESINYGTALSATQLNASVTTGDGQLTYNPALEVVLGAGNHLLSVTAAATNNYNTTTKTVSLTVNKAEQVITWSNPANIVYGTALSGTQLNATALGGATLTYSPEAGTVLGAGTRTLTVNAAEADNYKASSKSVEIIVEKAIVTPVWTAGTLEQTYDNKVKTVVATTAPAGLTLNYDFGSATPKNAGSYTVTATVNEANYKGSVSGTLKIGQAATSTVVTVNDATYNGSSHGGSAKVTGAAELDQAVTVYYEGIAPTVYATSTTAPTNAGTYKATATYAESADYLGSTDSKNFTISKANAFLSLSNLTHTYDGTVKSATATVSPEGLSGVIVSGSGTDAGSYSATASLNNPNYEATDVSGNLSISPASSTVNMSDVTVTFDGNAHAATASAYGAGGLNTSANFTYSYSGVAPTVYPASTNAPTNAGTYNVIATYTGDANHTGSSKTATVTINKATATLSLDNLTHTYDGTAKLATAISSPANLSGITISNNGKTDAGTYTVIASLNNPNYTAENVTGNLEIAKADQKINWTAPAAITYGTALSATQLNATVTGLAGGSAAGALTYAPASNTVLNAGTHTLSVTAAETTNYNEATETVSLTVNKAEQVITWSNPANIVYGTALSGTQLNATALGGAILTYSPEAGTVLGAGTRTLTVNAAEADNYKAGSKSVEIIVEKATATITLTAADLSQTFNGLAKSVGYSINPADVTGVTVSYRKNGTPVAAPINAGSYEVLATLINDNYSGSAEGTLVIAKALTSTVVSSTDATYNGSAHSASAKVTGAGSLDQAVTVYYAGVAPTVYPSSTTAPISAGTYSATSTYAENLNYLGSSDVKEFTIGKKAASVVVAAKTKVYGATDPVFTGTLTGFLENDNVEASYNREAGETVADGPYAITATLSPVAVLNNYEIINTSATLTITKKAASVTPIANGKTYGSSEPTLTGNLAGFLTSDNVTATYSRAVGETVVGGPYQISASLAPVGVLGNYDITYNTANFTIGKKSASVVVTTGKTKEYGAADPEFTGTLTGFLASDNVQAAYSRVAGETVAGGPYAISATLSPAAALGNYDISNTPAALTITKKALVVTAQNTSKYCGQSDPSFSVSYDGFVHNETSSVLGGILSYSLTANGNLNGVTQFDITPKGLTSNNYVITFTKGVLTVNGVSIDASASGSPVPFGSAATLSATVSPKVAGVLIIFKLDGTEKGRVLTNTEGLATLPITNLGVVNVYQVEASTEGGCRASIAYLPVYDPNGGFVTGGGWINSPAGAYVKDQTATGKANFGFVSRYKKGSTALDGETEFNFQTGNLKFNSTSYETATLVIGGAKASYRGVGTINGTGTYKFTLNAIDGQASSAGGSDRIRMKITDAAGATVYDNMIGALDNADISTVTNTTLGGGSIVIHEAAKTGTKTSSAIAVAELPVSQEVKFTSYPNPLTYEASVEFNVAQDEAYSLDIYDMKGALVKQLQKGKAKTAETITAKWDARSANVGVYIIRLTKGNEVKTLRVVRQ
ncbi:MBG domain-containing protein [Rufibacter hautae]|nr:MBG domain-containing protein [Rufibacter hautae]